MSIWIILTIILFTGLFGGFINFLLPSNTDTTGTKIRTVLQCMLLGIGAAILVPLFLEIAQSRLLDDIHYSWSLVDNRSEAAQQDKKADTAVKKDSMLKIASDTQIKKDSPKANTQSPRANTTAPGSTSPANKRSDPLKNYLLFMGYCFVAAVAGIRFINSLIDKILVEKQLAEKDKKIAQSESEKQKAEKERDQRAAQDLKEAEIEESRNVASGKVRITTLINPGLAGSAIGPVTVPGDRQKKRFGEKAENNKRKLSATVGDKPANGFYPFTLTVESTDAAHPLEGEVIFFLHDSFTPSVETVDVTEGKATFGKWSYGAFTVGAVCDGGKTLLELDLAEDKSFPKEFRAK